jgi:diguanylate cyclase (GGDEF)-like protein
VRNAQLYEDLRSQVDRDPLTGVLNHRAFYERLEHELARAERAGSHVAVIVVDLDDFKALNDTRGHVAGDTALRRVAAAIRSTCRAVDIPGRLGGDEFAVILPDVETDLDALAARLLEAIGAHAGLHASVGIAVAREPGATAGRTVARADSSLLEAKAAGKHTYRVAA